ncbi:hypothetical protein FHT44_005407 [Mycolicibacterium sp. BK634]|nr:MULTISPECIES: hypothetical protein [Mycobacteriaceae]MBB3752895.1 hypothetical protein [Mycolicibacterium sp. BK634]
MDAEQHFATLAAVPGERIVDIGWAGFLVPAGSWCVTARRP